MFVRFVVGCQTIRFTIKYNFNDGFAYYIQHAYIKLRASSVAVHMSYAGCSIVQPSHGSILALTENMDLVKT